MRIRSRRAVAVLAAVAVAALVAPASALTIDSFEVGDFDVSDDTLTSGATVGEQSGLPGSQVIGGVRLVSVQGRGPTNLGTRAQLVTNPDPVDDSVALTVLGVPTADSATFRFIYDGTANSLNDSFSGTLGVSLVGLDRFEIQTIGTTGAATVEITLWSTQLRRIAPITPLVANGVTSVPLTGFDGIDLGDIQTIQLVLDNFAPLDAPLISSFSVVVPEPGSGLLLGLGLTGLALRRRNAS